MTPLLSGKVALVTGAARGIGKAIAFALADAGMDILVCGREGGSGLPGTIGDTAAEICRRGRRGVAHAADLCNEAETEGMINRAMAEFGRLDVLVNNAAYFGTGTIMASPTRELDESLKVNLRAPYLASQLAIRIMDKQGGGAIFNITTPGARPLPPGTSLAQVPFRDPIHPAYWISKAALESLTRMLAHETADRHLAVAAIDPLFTDTERARYLVPAGIDTSFGTSPALVGKTVAFMATRPMDFSGQIVVVDDIAERYGLSGDPEGAGSTRGSKITAGTRL